MCFIFLFILRWGVALLPRLEYSGMIIAYCSQEVLDSSDLPASASLIHGIRGMFHHTQLHYDCLCLPSFLSY